MKVSLNIFCLTLIISPVVILRVAAQYPATGGMKTTAREVLVPAGMPALPHRENTLKSLQKDRNPDTLDLPFFDDFSRPGTIPWPEFWMDELVYVNNSYTRNPVTKGFATMDAMNEMGELNGEGPESFESDFLTSVPINLDFPGRDDIWLSFYYKPKGLGDKPEVEDSLVVEFYGPADSLWTSVWSSPGLEEEVVHETDTLPFKQAWIQVSDSVWLRKGFRFRFKNYVSFRSDARPDKLTNVDHWMIDYVYLDTARKANVTAKYDVSMISRLESLLKNYESIPWKHLFPKAYNQEIKSKIGIQYRNNDTIRRNATRILKITDLTYGYSDSVNGGATNIEASELRSFEFPYNYPFLFLGEDSAEFEIRSYLVTEDLDYKWNDTVTHIQKFYNYYAYDDGSAEDGYGIAGTGARGGSVAYRFENFRKDTLRGVNMYFNRTRGDASRDYFILGVWDHDDVNNAPGNLIYSMSGVKPEYGTELNEFSTYAFDSLLILPADKFFYVGWFNTTENLLNVGWDRWRNNNDKIFYNLGQGWSNSQFYGSLMIRPLFGHAISFPVSVPEIPSAPSVQNLTIRARPNPAMGEFYLDVQGASGSGWSVQVYNLQGRLVYSSDREMDLEDLLNTPHSVGDLAGGLYIVKLNREGLFRAGTKLLIAR